MIALKKDLIIPLGNDRGYGLYKPGEQFISLKYNINPDSKSMSAHTYLTNKDGMHVAELDSSGFHLAKDSYSVNGEVTELEGAFDTHFKDFMPVLTKKGLELLGALKVGNTNGSGVILTNVL